MIHGEKISWHIIGYLMLLRCKMVFRFLKELGWIRSVMVLVALAMLFLPIFDILDDRSAAIYLIIFNLSIISGIHFYRSDQHFIQSMGIREQGLFCVEYLLIALPVSFLLGYMGAWVEIFLLMLCCLMIAWIPVPPKAARNAKNALHIPFSISYEWASGLRKHKWTVAIFLISGAVGSALNLFIGWIFLFLMTAITALFYRYCEPVQFILLERKSPHRLITQKLMQGFTYYTFLTGLLWMAVIALHPGYYIYSLVFFLGNLFLLAVVITGKYAFYRAHANIETMTSMIFWFGCICLLVPYLPPVLFLLVIWLYWRGVTRLREEVYAFY